VVPDAVENARFLIDSRPVDAPSALDSSSAAWLDEDIFLRLKKREVMMTAA